MLTVIPPHCAITYGGLLAIALMSPALSVAASLSPTTRKAIGIEAVARSIPISHIAAQHQVSRKFVYQQGDKAQQALDESFAPSKGDDEVLFHLPVTKNWLYQLILGLVAHLPLFISRRSGAFS